MTRFDFSPLFRSTVGFDPMVKLLETASRAETAEHAYPPYNIQTMGQDCYRITLAVAGYAIDDLQIEVRENTLTVSGKRGEDPEGVAFLHKGIEGGAFERRFQLADYVQVMSAHLDNGLLYVDLVRELPETMKPQKIEIGDGSAPTIAGRAKKLVEKVTEAA